MTNPSKKLLCRYFVKESSKILKKYNFIFFPIEPVSLHLETLKKEKGI